MAGNGRGFTELVQRLGQAATASLWPSSPGSATHAVLSDFVFDAKPLRAGCGRYSLYSGARTSGAALSVLPVASPWTDETYAAAAISADGSTMAVAASSDTDGESGIRVFRRSGNGYAEHSLVGNGYVDESLTGAVAIGPAGDEIVTSYLSTGGNLTTRIFRNTSGTTWAEVYSGAHDLGFPPQMSDDGSTVCGAHFYDAGAGFFTGSVIVLRKTGGVWALEATITPPEAINAQTADTSMVVQMSGDGATIIVRTGVDALDTLKTYRRSSSGAWLVSLPDYSSALTDGVFADTAIDSSGDRLLAIHPSDGVVELVFDGAAWATAGITPYPGAYSFGGGLSVSADFNTAAFAADGDVLIFSRVSGVMTHQQTISGDSTYTLGTVMLHTDGRSLLATSTDEPTFNLTRFGMIYLFDYDGATWTKTAKLYRPTQPQAYPPGVNALMARHNNTMLSVVFGDCLVARGIDLVRTSLQPVLSVTTGSYALTGFAVSGNVPSKHLFYTGNAATLRLMRAVVPSPGVYALTTPAVSLLRAFPSCVVPTGRYTMGGGMWQDVATATWTDTSAQSSVSSIPAVNADGSVIAVSREYAQGFTANHSHVDVYACDGSTLTLTGTIDTGYAATVDNVFVSADGQWIGVVLTGQLGLSGIGLHLYKNVAGTWTYQQTLDAGALTNSSFSWPTEGKYLGAFTPDNRYLAYSTSIGPKVYALVNGTWAVDSGAPQSPAIPSESVDITGALRMMCLDDAGTPATGVFDKIGASWSQVGTLSSVRPGGFPSPHKAAMSADGRRAIAIYGTNAIRLFEDAGASWVVLGTYTSGAGSAAFSAVGISANGATAVALYQDDATALSYLVFDLTSSGPTLRGTLATVANGASWGTGKWGKLFSVDGRFVVRSLAHNNDRSLVVSLRRPGADVTLSKSRKLVVDSAGYAFQGYAALSTRTMPAQAGVFTLTGKAVGKQKASVLPVSSGAFTLVGHATLQANVLSVPFANYSLSFGAVRGQWTRYAIPGAYTVTGYSVSFHKGRRLSVATGAFVFSGNAATLNYDRAYHFTLATHGVVKLKWKRILRASAGSYALTPYATGPASNPYTISTGHYTLTGHAAGFHPNNPVMRVFGAFFSCRGYAVRLLPERHVFKVWPAVYLLRFNKPEMRASNTRMPVVRGDYSINTPDVSLRATHHYRMTAETYAFGVAASDVSLRRIRRIFGASAAGSYVVSGHESAGRRQTQVLNVATGAYVVSGGGSWGIARAETSWSQANVVIHDHVAFIWTQATSSVVETSR